MNEGEFFNRYVTKMRPAFDLVRVENSMGNGIPDISYASQGVQGWIELKVAHPGRKLFFEKFQIPWMKRRLKYCDTHLWVLATDQERVFLYRAKYVVTAPREIIHGSNKTWTVVKMDDLMAAAVIHKKPWDWAIIQQALI